ncbi:MAG: M56 family metallopeptidase [Gillisia sp.]
MGAYFLQIVFFQLIFLVVYEVLLKKETFFSYNRWYLLVTPVFSFILPLLKFPSLSRAVPGGANLFLPQLLVGNNPQQVETLPTIYLSAENGVSVNWWLIIYFLGILISFALFLKKSKNLNRLFRFRKVSEEKDFKIIEIPDSKAAFTFLTTVFLGDKLSDEEKKQILAHELVHVKQKHSLDLLLFEVFKILLWFNPLIYVYQQRIMGMHEFLADEQAVKTTHKKAYFEQLLNTAFNTQNISFINQFFSHSLIKKRIVMLQKSKSKSIAKIKYLVLIPLMLIMVTYVSCTEDHSSLGNDQEVNSISSQIDKLELSIQEKDNLSQEEKDKMVELMKKVVQKSVAGNKGSSSSTSSITVKGYSSNGADVPFAVIDQVPIFPGCENLTTNKEKKDCMTSKIQNFVAKNFDIAGVKPFSKKGVNRVIVQFKIDKTGSVTDIKARASSPELENEAKRLINSLPKMEPGKQKGQPVNVVYSLPIVFQNGK